jgi:hypothetical protein
MSTSYLHTNRNAAALYALQMNRNNAGTSVNNRTQAKTVPARQGIDEGLLMIGVFCFLVPTMFASAALGLKYLEMSDLIANGLYISAAALTARIATAMIIKNMAAEKNRSQATWMTLAMIAPAVSLILMSFFGTIPTETKSTASTNTAKIKNHTRAREIQMHRKSQAI